MTNKLKFIFCVHNHQPIGNFEHVVERVFFDAYEPFIRLMTKFKDIKFCLHTSGSLLEWIEYKQREYIEQVKEFIKKNRVEILGGGKHDPILTMIPSRDRIGQIISFREYLKGLFNVDVRGMWIPERVWQSHLVKDIVNAGISYAPVDDVIFKYVGLNDEQLDGYYITEEEGSQMKIFAISEELRYSIPFKDPNWTIDYLKRIADRGANKLVVYADDGEKFGGWPRTKKHCWNEKWMERFFETLDRNSSWIETITFSEAIEELTPRGIVYLADGSYREMTEWVLQSENQQKIHQLIDFLKEKNLYEQSKQFIKGGTFKTFISKYDETLRLYAKMLHTSRSVAGIKDEKKKKMAQEELYKGQCNCGYWHGVFGGLYLPHLRDSVYSHLTKAHSIALSEKSVNQNFLCEEFDFNFDGKNEFFITNFQYGIYIDLNKGGVIGEFDIYNRNFNIANTMTRYYEHYHEKAKSATYVPDFNGETVSIHHLVVSKEPEIWKKLIYDTEPRFMFKDKILGHDANLDNLKKNKCKQLAKFLKCTSAVVREGTKNLDVEIEYQLEFENKGKLNVEKIFTLPKMTSSKSMLLLVNYKIENLSADDLKFLFASESTVNFLARNSPDRYFFIGEKKEYLGGLETECELSKCSIVGIRDDSKDIDFEFDFKKNNDKIKSMKIYIYPVESVSLSESGFESVYQGSAIIPIWDVTLHKDSIFETSYSTNIRLFD